MGLIRAAAGAVGGTLADSWLEYITAGDMGANTVMTKGVQIKRGKHGSNTKGTPDIISNGSRVEVGPNQMMILVDSGRIMDYTAEEGCYEVFLSSSPSMFNGQLKDSVRESFERFKFGGQPGKSQQVYFINLQEIRGIKFGTRNALQYFDNFYNAELFVRCHGSYSIKITDPLKFFMEVVPRNATSLTFDELGDQFNMEFLSALQSAIGQMSVDGVRISALPSKSMELSKYMATVLDEDWTQARGVDICAVGIGSISYDEESKALINMRNQGAMMGDPSVREGFVQSAVAKGLQPPALILPVPDRRTWQWAWVCRVPATSWQVLPRPMPSRCSNRQWLSSRQWLNNRQPPLQQLQTAGPVPAALSTAATSVPTAAAKNRLLPALGSAAAVQKTPAISAPTAAAKSQLPPVNGPVPAALSTAAISAPTAATSVDKRQKGEQHEYRTIQMP